MAFCRKEIFRKVNNISALKCYRITIKIFKNKKDFLPVHIDGCRFCETVRLGTPPEQDIMYFIGAHI